MSMTVEIREVGPENLGRYGTIPIRFCVDRVLRVDEVDGGLGGLTLTQQPVETPYVKDYDDLQAEPLTRWVERFDVSNWLFLMALDGDRPVGGAVVAYRSPKVTMLEGRTDLAVVWDLRVHPDYRGQGIGTRLWQRAAEWARARDCTQLKVETQNINLRACRFYAARGCHLGAIVRHAYTEPDIRHEAMLLWYLDL